MRSSDRTYQKDGSNIRQDGGEQIHVSLKTYGQENEYSLCESDINLNGLCGGEWVHTVDYKGKTYRLSVSDLTIGGGTMTDYSNPEYYIGETEPSYPITPPNYLSSMPYYM